jgi:hypothetical protein
MPPGKSEWWFEQPVPLLLVRRKDTFVRFSVNSHRPKEIVDERPK